MYSKNFVSEFKDSEVAIMVSEIIINMTFFFYCLNF